MDELETLIQDGCHYRIRVERNDFGYWLYINGNFRACFASPYFLLDSLTKMAERRLMV